MLNKHIERTNQLVDKSTSQIADMMTAGGFIIAILGIIIGIYVTKINDKVENTYKKSVNLQDSIQKLDEAVLPLPISPH